MSHSKEPENDQIEGEEKEALALLPRRQVLVGGLMAGAGAMGLSLLGRVPAFAAPVSPLGTTTQLQVVASGNDGRIYHTIRHADGSWVPSFDVANSVVSNGDNFPF